MKTAISIPNEVFEAADQLALRLQISRSRLYAAAVSAYLDSHRYQGVTTELNKVYEHEDSTLDEGLAALQAESLPVEEW